MHDGFFELAERVFAEVRGDEIASLSVAAERSSFARLNHARVRQAGDVAQDVLELTLIRGARHASARRTSRGAGDGASLRAMLGELRALLDAVPDDPHLHYDREPRVEVEETKSALPPPHDAVASILDAAGDHDLVGLYQSGAIHRGLATSIGHRLFETIHTFHFDFSLYAQRDKAAKGLYAGTRFDETTMREKLSRAARQVEILRRPEKRIDPGRYRVYLTPRALAEIVGLLAFDAFGVKEHRTKQTALLRLLENGASLSPKVTLADEAASGVAPPFLPGGFARPPRIELFTEGRLTGALVSPRSAHEYDLPVNAGHAEQPSALAMAPGELAEAGATRELGTGVYVTDTWYTNYSDRASGRITGTTRFATSWVEGGEIVAPLSVMRFDDTLYRMLGSELVALTREREWMLDGDSYGGRSTGSMLLPGVLLASFTFTL